jgi:hypothetical protein
MFRLSETGQQPGLSVAPGRQAAHHRGLAAALGADEPRRRRSSTGASRGPRRIFGSRGAFESTELTRRSCAPLIGSVWATTPPVTQAAAGRS